jgi:hypothetical protein
MQGDLAKSVRALLRLSRHAEGDDVLCHDCLQNQIREELASLSWAQDIDLQALGKTNKMGAPH